MRNVLFYHSPPMSPDSGRKSVHQLLQVLRAAENRRVGRAERGLDLLQWLFHWRRLRVLKSKDPVVVAEGEEI